VPHPQRRRLGSVSRKMLARCCRHTAVSTSLAGRATSSRRPSRSRALHQVADRLHPLMGREAVIEPMRSNPPSLSADHALRDNAFRCLGVGEAHCVARTGDDLGVGHPRTSRERQTSMVLPPFNRTPRRLMGASELARRAHP
jgi:hypothetical protein